MIDTKTNRNAPLDIEKKARPRRTVEILPLPYRGAAKGFISATCVYLSGRQKGERQKGEAPGASPFFPRTLTPSPTARAAPLRSPRSNERQPIGCLRSSSNGT